MQLSDNFVKFVKNGVFLNTRMNFIHQSVKI